MKKRNPSPPLPSALAAGLLQDSGRALFLVRKNPLGQETVEIPFVLLQKGENPVAAIASEFRRQAGIDAQAHEILFEKRHNAGTRKRKLFVPAFAFRMTAKNASCRPAPEFSGYRWLSPEDLLKHRLARNCEWLRQ